MAWLSSVTDDNTIVVSVVKYVRRIIYLGSGTVNKQTVTRTEKHYVGLTSAAADTQLTASAETIGCVSAKKEKENDAGAYTVIEEIETATAWVYDETWSEVLGP